MISMLGRGLILLALAFAASGAVIGFVSGVRASAQGWKWARQCAYGFGASAILANLLMIYALVTHDFSVHYVAEVGSTTTPTYYTIISLWASLNGSILFWAGILGVYVAVFAWRLGDRHREYMPYTLGTLLAVCVFFGVLVAGIANPFELVDPAPTEGPGPNPLLQNHWLMAFHPPTLYLGYVGMSVPFSMASGALLAGRLEAGWIAPMRIWTLVPWGFLTVAIMLGGWWSYEVLGWGGYWAWDPVENASFLPWLTCTAFLHSAMVMQRRGTLKTWSLVLMLASFLLTLVGTFMTRSGVFNSVHSFTQSDIGPTFLVFIAICFLWSVGLLATRDHLIEGDKEERAPNAPVSREVMILLQNIAFSVFTFTVLLGTLYPLIAEAIDGTRVSVGEPFFERMALPLGLVIVLLMGVGPAIPWGRSSTAAAGSRLGIPVGIAVVSTVVLYAVGIHGPYALLSLAVCVFALVISLRELVEPVVVRIRKGEAAPAAALAVLTRTHRRVGAHIAHIGVVITTAAIAISMGYQQTHDTSLRVGETENIAGFDVTFTGAKTYNEPHRESRAAEFTVAKGGVQKAVLDPRLNYYKRMREPVGTPAVLESPIGDLYLSLQRIEPGGDRASIRALYTPAVVWVWVGPIIIALGSALSAFPMRRQRAGQAERKSA